MTEGTIFQPRPSRAMRAALVPWVRIRTRWSDDKPDQSGYMEEWFAEWALLLYADATLWTPLQHRPVSAKLVDRIWMPADSQGPVQ